MKLLSSLVFISFIATIAFQPNSYARSVDSDESFSPSEASRLVAQDTSKPLENIPGSVSDVKDSEKQKYTEDKIPSGQSTENKYERKGESKPEPEKKETSAPVVKKSARDLFITKNPDEHVGLILSYGGFFPVADYGARYKPASLFAACVPVYYINFFGILPEAHVRYTMIRTKPSMLRSGSSISIWQVFPALVYRYDVELPGSFRGPFTVFGRIYDGIARVDFKSGSPLAPLFGENNIIEIINVFGISAGCTLTLYRGLFAGFEVGYSIIATAGSPLQSVSVLFNAGYRI